MDLYELTRADITALRTANTVVFVYNGAAHPVTREAQTARASYIRAIKEPTMAERDRDPFAREIVHVIDLGEGKGSHRLTDYEGGGDHEYTATAVLLTCRYDERWQSVARSLKVGESIVMHWQRNNDNGYVREAGLHVDSLDLVIGREGKPARHYHVAESITPDNSARMVHVTGTHGR